jgi:hypothetical protein
MGEWKFLFRRARGFFTRGYRGWADYDTWGLDHYLAGVLAGSLRHLAKHKQGCPSVLYEQWGDKAFDIWRDQLLAWADWFEWYYLDEDGTSEVTGWIDPTVSEEEKRKRIDTYMKKMEKFLTEIVPDFAKHWGDLWD